MRLKVGARLLDFVMLLLFVTTLGSAIQVAGLGQAGTNHVHVEFDTYYIYETRQVGEVSNQELLGRKETAAEIYNSKDVTSKAVKDPTLVFSTDLPVSWVGYEEYLVPPYRWELPDLPEEDSYYVGLGFSPSEDVTYTPGFSVDYSIDPIELSAPDGIQKVRITVTPEDMELMITGQLSVSINIKETDQVIPTITSITAGRGNTWLDPEGQSAWWGSGEGPGGKYIIEATIEVALKEEVKLAKHLPTVDVRADIPQGDGEEDATSSLNKTATTGIGTWKWQTSEPYIWSWEEKLRRVIRYQGFSAPGFHPPTKEALNAAIEKGLDWLRAHQNDDGSWDYSRPSSHWKPFPNVGVTSQAALAFLLHGYTEEDPTVKKAIQYILDHQDQRYGCFYSDEHYYHSITYETSLSILPLVATRNPEYEDEIAKARDWLVAAQNDEDHQYRSELSCPDPDTCWAYGGWCYSYYCTSTYGVPAELSPYIHSDLSNTQFAMMALKWAGLPPDGETWKKAKNFISRCQNPDGGFTYMPIWKGRHSIEWWNYSRGSMTAAGIWGLELSGAPVRDERIQKGLEWLRRFYSYSDNPQVRGWTSFVYYYIWTATRAFLHTEIPGVLKPGPPLEGWYWDFAGYLIESQEDDGSWISPTKEDESVEYATTLALLVLEKMGLPT